MTGVQTCALPISCRDVEDAYEEGSFDYAQLILGSVTDEYSIDDGHTRLTVLKKMGGAE